jgi:hypothetical protein
MEVAKQQPALECADKLWRLRCAERYSLDNYNSIGANRPRQPSRGLLRAFRHVRK